ncbi:MAG: PduL/EutD family phosphate acyltransferase, partial [Oscillospiraceae bacterium]
MKILVETSARHVHVTEADLETLFGKGYKLTPKKDLS